MLDKLLERSREFDSHKTEFLPRSVGHFSWNEATADLQVPAFEEVWGKVELEPTAWAFRQACGRLGPACFPGSQRSLPVNYLEKCPLDLRASHLNHWQKELALLAPREWRIRAYEEQVRAILSGQFVPIDISDTLGWIISAVDSKGPPGGVEVIEASVTRDVLHVSLIIKSFQTGTGPGDVYALGAYFTTGEIGNRRLGVYPMVQRTSCRNSLAYSGAGAYEHMHRGNRETLRVSFIAHIFEAVEASEVVLDRLLSADVEQLPNFADAVGDLAKKRGWAEVVKDQILIGSEGHQTLWGMVMGVSAAAKLLEDPTDRADMQKAAGDLLLPVRRQRSLRELVGVRESPVELAEVRGS